ncbi:MAG: hypothetical protein KDK70_07670 [Myxococcales bacterium]|nr:hypothetical protein [Myxococcales bacterium]
MSSKRRSTAYSIALLLGLMSALAFETAACNLPPPSVSPEDLEQLEESEGEGEGAQCNSSDCYSYCEYARCLFPDDADGSQCEAHCTEHCGNGRFDDVDARVLSCQFPVAYDPTCEQSQACCQENSMSEICERPSAFTSVACDPEACLDYCEHARCLFEGDLTGEQCETRCKQECGDGMFEESDHTVLECQKAVTDDPTCEQSRACCRQSPTNELCPPY